MKELGSIFSIIDHHKQGQGESKMSKDVLALAQLVSDVGVQQTTLEEVFMTITTDE